MSMEYYDVHNVSSEDCYSWGKVFFDSFRNDLFLRSFYPEMFGPEPTMADPLRSQVLKRVSRIWSREAKAKILTGAEILCLVRDNGECVAVCFSILPEHERFRLTWLQWLRLKTYKIYSSIANFFDGSLFIQMDSPEFLRFMGSMYTECGAIEKPEYYAKLAEMSYNELAKTRYPHKETFYTNILGVRSDQHGKGYGTRLLYWTLYRMRHLKGPIFKYGNKESERGPAKASLFPTENNETFYNRLGYQTVKSAVVPLVGDETYEHKFMQRFLANDTGKSVENANI